MPFREKYNAFREKMAFIEKEKKRKRIIYKKQRCAFTLKNGNRCRRNAVGSGAFCKKHGGVIKKECLVPIVRTEEYMKKYHRNSKFLPEEHPNLFIEYSKMGLSTVEIAAKFNVSPTTLHNWVETYEIFNDAYEIGEALHETWWLEKGKDNLNTPSFNTNLFKFLTSNKLGYSEKREAKNLNMNVHGVLVVPPRVTQDEWSVKAAQTIKERSVIDAEFTEEDSDE